MPERECTFGKLSEMVRFEKQLSSSKSDDVQLENFYIACSDMTSFFGLVLRRFQIDFEGIFYIFSSWFWADYGWILRCFRGEFKVILRQFRGDLKVILR